MFLRLNIKKIINTKRGILHLKQKKEEQNTKLESKARMDLDIKYYNQMKKYIYICNKQRFKGNINQRIVIKRYSIKRLKKWQGIITIYFLPIS